MTINSSETSAVYSLSERFIDGQVFGIDADQYATLSEALTTVVSAMEIEELFQVFAQSFLRFEKDLLDTASECAFANMLSNGNELFFSTIRHRINTNIITILTSYKSYDDHCDRILKPLINPSEAKEFNHRIRSKTFESHLSYRICAKLRDYAQHRALPLGGFSIGGKTNIGRDNSGQLRKLDTGFNVSPWLDVSKFKSSSQCKAPLRKELEKLGYEKIDMKWLIRSFSGAMYERHAELRAFLKPTIVAAGEKITSGYDLASTLKNSEAKFLELCGGDEKRPMRNDLAAKVLRDFQTWSSLQGAERSYVTSQITPENATYSGQVDA
ncbi:MAG: hypothetical protein U5N10_17690 [Gemmobacter sp.]|nr:hypothetical protein [Gemmobacter sp.]